MPGETKLKISMTNLQLKYALILLFIHTLMAITMGQSYFPFETNHILSKGHQLNGELSVCVADFDNDLKDDIAILDKGTDLVVLYQELRGEPFSMQPIDQVGLSEQWSILAADIDRNGWKDIVICGDKDGIKIYYQDDGQWTKSLIPVPSLFFPGNECS